MVPIRYVNDYLHVKESYLFDPNRGPEGVAAVSSQGGLFLAMMIRMFRSARAWVG
ncbi:hypothetical protein F4779DRAFT_598731 [Xylariaceae sp. FL0662B]|nr:hypothetical protein F4779DRAFT_598731 [Xylariaceae sp. FL0662B]